MYSFSIVHVTDMVNLHRIIAMRKEATSWCVAVTAVRLSSCRCASNVAASTDPREEVPLTPNWGGDGEVLTTNARTLKTPHTMSSTHDSHMREKTGASSDLGAGGGGFHSQQVHYVAHMCVMRVCVCVHISRSGCRRALIFGTHSRAPHACRCVFYARSFKSTCCCGLSDSSAANDDDEDANDESGKAILHVHRVYTCIVCFAMPAQRCSVLAKYERAPFRCQRNAHTYIFHHTPATSSRTPSRCTNYAANSILRSYSSYIRMHAWVRFLSMRPFVYGLYNMYT